MTLEDPYVDFQKALKRAGGAIPAIPVEELFLLLKELVLPEEALLASSLPDEWVSAESHARTLSRPVDEISSMLEIMTDKGIIHAKKGPDGIYKYKLMPLLPGIYEMQFYRGTKTERDYRIARLFKNYLDALNKIRDSLSTPPPIPSTSYFRVLPVQKEVEAATEVLTYARISKFLEKIDAIAVGTCFCRHHAILLDERDNCGVSHRNCLAFGEMARFVVDRKIGTPISKDEAMRILEDAEEEGLVHCSANTSEELAFICNCCTCHCGILREAKRVPQSSYVLTSGYYASVYPELCIACETCQERCPMNAIHVDDVASVYSLRCIGCGLCARACPSEAIKLVIRRDAKVPPQRLSDLEKAMRRKDESS